MTTQATLQLIDSLANAGFLWGPFFFSILFMLVITRTAHSYYSRVNERINPPASPTERHDYRFYFHLSIVCGTILVFLSVGWWIYAQLKQHTFQGVIVGLEQDQQIVAADNDLYYRAVQREAGDGHIMRDYYFAIVRSSPFLDGQSFRLELYPDSGRVGEEKPKPVDLIIKYHGGTNEKFMISHEGDSFKLVPVGG